MRKIAVVGFSSFEFGAFDAFFKMVGVSRPPGYVISNSPHEAELIFVNGVSRMAIDAVSGLPRNPKIVVVGAENFGTKYLLLGRPIRLTAALALANQLLAAEPQHARPQPQAAFAPIPASQATAPRAPLQTAVGGLRAGTVQSVPPVARERAESPIVLDPAQLLSTPAPTESRPQYDDDPTLADLSDDILVVDDSDIALRFMQDHLGAFGFRVHLAKSGEECLLLLNQRAFRCVFLDVMMSGIDGYQTCRMIKQRKYKTGTAPTVIMMTSRSGAIDRVRGALSGCDGYLVKPVDETKLIKALFQHRVSTSPLTSSKLQVRLTTLSR